MILNSIDKQFKLADSGEITWQKDLTNPMPGVVVAKVQKGDSVLVPICTLVEAAETASEDQEKLKEFITQWLGRYVGEILAPIFKLKDEDIAEGAPRDIAAKLYDALGILPREDLQSLIAQMDEEKRASLRSKKIRFGPLLVYLPELNKPAAVKLRALLLTLSADKNLPAEVPQDGIVSFSVVDNDIDKAYYQAIGYPVYGPRSVRVDMLDRLVCAVYDTAKEGKFQAQHQMAEWLGSNIADLYAVLEAMGHKKIHDPADEVVEEVKEETKEEIKDEVKENSPEVKIETVKPELATFALKKGKAIGSTSSEVNQQSPKKFDQKFSKTKFSSKPQSKKPAKKPQGQRVYKAEVEAKPEDNPFAILQQLKTGDKDK